MFVVGNHGIFLGGKEDARPDARWGAGSQPAHFIEYPSYALHYVPRIGRIKLYKNMSLPGTVGKNLAYAHLQIGEAGATERPNAK